MSEKISINELLKRNTSACKIDKIPTSSRREVSARKTLNEILSEHEEWFPCIAAIVVYPIQQWAKNARKDLGIDLLSLDQIIENHESYFGISSVGRFETQRNALLETNKEIEVVRDILKQKPFTNEQEQMLSVINAIHGIDGDDVSQYMMNTYYRGAIETICKKYNDQFRSFSMQMKPKINDKEFEAAYHNTDLMIRQLNSISDMNKRWRGEVSYRAAYETMISCIRSLKMYSIDGPLLMEIAMRYAEGYPELRIATELNKSRTFVRGKYQNAVEILSYLLWGYSTRDVLQSHLTNT